MKPEEKPRHSYRCGPYVLDDHAGEVRTDGEPIQLTDTAFEVFYQLVEARGRTVLRQDFNRWKRVGHSDGETGAAPHPEWRRPVDVYVTELRKKLGASIIKSVRGKGYRLGRSFAVEVIAIPSAAELERLITIALNQIKEHSSASFRAAINNCQELLKAERIPDAYAVLALAYINLGHVGFCRELPRIAIAKARETVTEALRCYPEFGSMYALRGLTSLIYDYDWDRAERDFRRALIFNPNNELGHCFLSHLLVARRKFDEGLKHARIAAEVDYDSAMTVMTEPWLMMFASHIGDAVTTGERVVKRFEDSAPAHSIMGHIYRAAGAVDRAVEQYNAALQIEFLPEAAASLGFVYAELHQRDKALRSLATIEEATKRKPLAYVSGYFYALVYAGLGEKRQALDALNRAYNEKCDWLIHMDVEPRWYKLKNERRFVELMRRVGLKKRRSTASR